MDYLNKIKEICRVYDIKPNREHGQNFLVNPEILDDIMAAADIQPTDLVLEVGPGLGVLTERLVSKAKKVVAVELDRKLFSFLQTKFIDAKNLELIQADILKFLPTKEFGQQEYKIVANLPYNISSIFLKTYLNSAYSPSSMVLMLQREVAERICAEVGEMSLLAVSVQLSAKPKIISTVDKFNFWPAPQVDSAIIKLDNIKTPQQLEQSVAPLSGKQFWQVVKIGFSAKRKQLRNNLANGLHISADQSQKILLSVGVEPSARAQNLSLTDWKKVAQAVQKLG